MPLARSKFPRGSSKPYRVIRPELRHGDILLCSGRGLFSTMIRQATNSVWSHVGFVLRSDQVDRVMLLESVEPIGVRTVRLSKYLYDYDTRGNPYFGGIVVIRHKHFDDEIDKRRLRRFAQYGIDRFGFPYDKVQIAKIAGRILTSGLRRHPQKRFADNRAFICSEYVARCFEHIKIRIQWDRRGFIAPADFAVSKSFELIAILKRPRGKPPK